MCLRVRLYWQAPALSLLDNIYAAAGPYCMHVSLKPLQQILGVHLLHICVLLCHDG